MKTVESTIEQILKRGTGIVSFEYNNKKRNVTVGAHLGKALEKRGLPLTGKKVNTSVKKINRAVYQNAKGRKMLRGIVQNDNSSPIKNFFLDEIKNFTYNKVTIE